MMNEYPLELILKSRKVYVCVVLFLYIVDDSSFMYKIVPPLPSSSACSPKRDDKRRIQDVVFHTRKKIKQTLCIHAILFLGVLK